MTDPTPDELNAVAIKIDEAKLAEQVKKFSEEAVRRHFEGIVNRLSIRFGWAMERVDWDAVVTSLPIPEAFGDERLWYLAAYRLMSPRARRLQREWDMLQPVMPIEMKVDMITGELLELYGLNKGA